MYISQGCAEGIAISHSSCVRAGTGTNAAYVESVENVEFWQKHRKTSGKSGSPESGRLTGTGTGSAAGDAPGGHGEGPGNGNGNGTGSEEESEEFPPPEDDSPYVVINTEWGNFGSIEGPENKTGKEPTPGPLDFIRTDIDKLLDNFSLNPGTLQT